MRVVDDFRRPIRDSREAADLAAQLPARQGARSSDPEVAAMLDEFIREYEARWLDEPIPHSTVTHRGRPLTIPRGAAT